MIVANDMPIQPPALDRIRESLPPLPSTEQPTIIICAGANWRFLNFRELWQYRDLLYFLVWRDVKVRYKQTILGAAWAILQPVATMVVFTMFFRRATSMPTDGESYPLFVLAGLLPWFFLSNAISSASQSIISNQGLVTKIYFPRVLIPMSSVGAGVIDFGVSLLVLIAIMGFYRVVPGPSLLALPLLIGMLVLTAFGIGTLLSALTVAYRDFRHVVPFGLQLWMFATPAIYLTFHGAHDSHWQWWLPLNPAHGLIENFRAAALGGQLNWYSLAVSSLVSLALIMLGGFYFRKVERRFADEI